MNNLLPLMVDHVMRGVHGDLCVPMDYDLIISLYQLIIL